ncbi:MAG: ABC transporter substrate-binding protein [Nocardioides sp.]
MPRLLVAALIGLIGVVGTTPATSQAADEKVRFTVALLNEVDSFNPFLGVEAPSYEMWGLTYDYLVGYSMTDMSPEPSLATEWETSADGLTWTFTMRDDVTWSDGKKLTAADVAYTYTRVIEGEAEQQNWSNYLKSVESVTAPDDTTVVMTLEKPNAVLPLLPIPIVPEHVWSRVSASDVASYANEPSDGKPVVGSGAFRLIEGTAGGSTYRFEANPDYWDGAPHIDEVVFKVYKSEDPAVQALTKGEVDFAWDLQPTSVKKLQGQPGITAASGDSPGFDEIAFNTGSIDTETERPIGDVNPAVKDPKFRHALGYALDLELLNERVYQGAGQAGDSIVPPSYPNWRWEPPAEEAFSYDPEKAGQLLDEAGYRLGDDGLRTLPSGEPIGKLRLFARADSATSPKVMEFFGEWLKDVGIDSELTVVEESKLTDIVLKGDYDAFEWGWFVEPDPDYMLSVFTCDQFGGLSDSWYCTDEYDDLYAEQNSAVDDEKRVELVKRMQEILFRDSPYLVTSYNTIGEAFRSDRFACLRQQPDPGGVYIIQYGVYNYKNMRPADEAGDCGGDDAATKVTGSGNASDGGVGTGTLIGLGTGAVVLAGAGLMLARRRGASAEDRE